MEEEAIELHTPTKSELATFQVLANLDFVNFEKPVPSSHDFYGPRDIANQATTIFEDQDYDQYGNVNVLEDEQILEGGMAGDEDDENDHIAAAEVAEELYPEMPPNDDYLYPTVELAKDEYPVADETTPRAAFPLHPSMQQTPPKVEVEDDEDEEEEEVKEEQPFTPSKPATPPPKSKKVSSWKPKQEDEFVSPPRQSRYKSSTQAEIDAEKEALLSELLDYERKGLIKLVRPLTMADSLEEIQFQYDRAQAEFNSNQAVDFAKMAIKMGSGMLENLLKRAGIKVVDGYNADLCKDMKKFDRPLGRLYKKYWRRGGMSPEMELGMIVFGSLAWTVVRNKMGPVAGVFGGGGDTIPPPPAMDPPAAAAAPPRPMRPPQMPSLHVPSAWATGPSPPPPPSTPPLRPDDATIKLREDLEALKASLTKKEMDLKRMSEGLESRFASLSVMESMLDQKQHQFQQEMAQRFAELEAQTAAAAAAAAMAVGGGAAAAAEEEVDDEPVQTKRVTLTSATPKKSARKRILGSTALVLDMNNDL